MSCPSCNNKLPKDGDYVLCQYCDSKYHFPCASIAKTTWKAKSKAKKAEWKCSNCRNNTNITEQQHSDDPLFQSIKTLLEKMFESHEKTITKRIDELNESISNIQSQLKSVLDQVKEIDATTEHLKTEIEFLKTTVESEKQYSRSKNFIISGIPMQRDENIKLEVSKLLSEMKIYHHPGEMTVHRLPTKTGEPQVFVQCYTREARDYIVRQARKIRPKLSFIAPTAEDKPIYFNDHTTPYFTQLMLKAKAIKKEKNYKYVWLDGNKIMMKKDDRAKPIRIFSDKDFNSVQ